MEAKLTLKDGDSAELTYRVKISPKSKIVITGPLWIRWLINRYVILDPSYEVTYTYGELR